MARKVKSETVGSIAYSPDFKSPPVKVGAKYDWLKFPASLLNFKEAGITWNEPGERDKAVIEQYERLLSEGYSIKQFTLHGDSVFLLLEKNA